LTEGRRRGNYTRESKSKKDAKKVHVLKQKSMDNLKGRKQGGTRKGKKMRGNPREPFQGGTWAEERE